MKVTSHFIGLPLCPREYADLFSELYGYVSENNLTESILFQNPLSIHISLYYLEAIISESEYDKISHCIGNTIIHRCLSLGEIQYFYRNDEEYIAYLSIRNGKQLEDVFGYFHKTLQMNNIFENTLAYVPHITLFKVHDYKTFKIYKAHIENIIHSWTGKQGELIHFESPAVYAVNSTFQPELQIKLSLREKLGL